jgi:Leucine-rich repeat (LRR) protein
MNFHNEDNEPKNVKLSLDTLHLEYNAIETVPPASFQYFEVVNKTYLDGNPIKMLGDDAFRSARIRELYIRHCDLTFISPKSFSGLEPTLQILDMSGNNITDLPEKIFNSFDVLR